MKLVPRWLLFEGLQKVQASGNFIRCSLVCRIVITIDLFLVQRHLFFSDAMMRLNLVSQTNSTPATVSTLPHGSRPRRLWTSFPFGRAIVRNFMLAYVEVRKNNQSTPYKTTKISPVLARVRWVWGNRVKWDKAIQIGFKMIWGHTRDRKSVFNRCKQLH